MTFNKKEKPVIKRKKKETSIQLLIIGLGTTIKRRLQKNKEKDLKTNKTKQHVTVVKKL